MPLSSWIIAFSYIPLWFLWVWIWWRLRGRMYLVIAWMPMVISLVYIWISLFNPDIALTRPVVRGMLQFINGLGWYLTIDFLRRMGTFKRRHNDR